ncbi:MAG TPA: di-trans,poly-cis-decaprenylcistransferase [Actinobacteria bacterium]|nr:di-trans,poly-cis-decaprenylcistransferase [Actinomycetota bacterium]
MPGRSAFSRPLYRLYEDRLVASLDRDALPRHIGVIHDGHRRYARAEGLPNYAASYRAGMEKFVEFLGWTDELEIEAVTCWLLSKENLARPAEELEPYYAVLEGLFRRLPAELDGRDVSVRFIGSLDLLPSGLVEAAKELEDARRAGRRRLTIALAYGGRQEIVDAVRDLVRRLVDEGVAAHELVDRIDAEGIAANLYTADLPDPDLVIRTSGEARLSGFLLWQSAYAEYSFVDVYWPAFRRVDFLRSLRDYTRRERRYGR